MELQIDCCSGDLGYSSEQILFLAQSLRKTFANKNRLQPEW
jgi:hypothetical protein